MKLNNLGTFSAEESRSSCSEAWHMAVAWSPSFPSILFVTCCMWLCLRAIKAINSHSSLFNSVQRNIGAGPSETCQAAPRVMALGIHSVVTTSSACGVPLLSYATSSLKVPAPSCFVLPGTTWVQWSECFPDTSRVLASTVLKEEKCYCLISKSFPTGFLFTCCRGHSELCMGKAAEDTLFSSLWCLDHVWCSCRTLWNLASYFSDTWKKQTLKEEQANQSKTCFPKICINFSFQ